jgi:hypothetical protein
MIFLLVISFIRVDASTLFPYLLRYGVSTLVFFAPIANVAIAVRVTRGPVTVRGYLWRTATLLVCSAVIWTAYFLTAGDLTGIGPILLAVAPYLFGWIFFRRSKAKWKKHIEALERGEAQGQTSGT